MPQIHFQIQWPDGYQETCYSPSLIVKDYFTPGHHYSLHDFVERARTALKIASDRVEAKYGMPCGMALRQLSQIETTALRYTELPEPSVQLIQFIESS